MHRAKKLHRLVRSAFHSIVPDVMSGMICMCEAISSPGSDTRPPHAKACKLPYYILFTIDYLLYPGLNIYRVIYMNYSNDTVSAIIGGTANSVSILVCLLAVTMVIALKLYKKAVYRLALYQVLSSLALAAVEVLQTIFVNYSQNPLVYGRVCTGIGYLASYVEWMKLLFTMWVTFHIFCFVVLHKNQKRFEVLYWCQR